MGEAPGRQEERTGQVFIGKTGYEVDRHYLPLAGLRRSDVTFTNAIRCLPPSTDGKLDPESTKDVALLDSCANAHLYPLIERMQPSVIVPMGNFACQAVAPGTDLDLQHGIPVMTDWGIEAFPMYHPALGLHEPKRMLHVRTDWHRLGRFLKGTLRVVTDAHPNPDYREVTDATEIKRLDPTRPLAGDTESGKDGPFCLTYSQQPGTGRLIRATRPDILRAFHERMQVWESSILFHNWLYDWPITLTLGVEFPPRRVVDTMARVYHLGNLPQGLKALAYRELGMQMQDFTDVVTPHSRLKVIEYYQEAAALDWERPEAELVRNPKTQQWKLYQAQSMTTKFKVFFTYLRKNPNKDVFQAWSNWEAEQPVIEARLGRPWPGQDINHVPFEQALYYACRDSDALIRLWEGVLTKMPRAVRRCSQEWWREKTA